MDVDHHDKGMYQYYVFKKSMTEEPNCLSDNATVILDEEPDVGSGMAAALKLAMSKGYLEKEDTKRIVISKSAQELQAQRYTIEDKATYV